MPGSSSLKIDRRNRLDRPKVWLPLLVCLILLGAGRATCDGCTSTVFSGLQTRGHAAVGPARFGPGAVEKQTDARLFLLSLAETEVADFEPAMLRHKAVAVPFIGRLTAMLNVWTVFVGGCVPLYLAHKVLLC